MSKCVVWVVETYNSGEFHFGYVYPPRSVGRQQREMILLGMVTVDLTTLLLSLSLYELCLC